MRVRMKSTTPVVAGALALCALTTPTVHAAAVTPRTSAGGAPPSFALMGVGSQAQAVVNVASGTPSAAAAQPEASNVAGTAIDPAGRTALIGAGQNFLVTLHGLRTATPAVGAPVSLKQFTGEGGKDYEVYADGVAISGTAALVAIDSAGVVQLREKQGRWQVDTRVHTAGTNEAGKPHAAGFIRSPGLAGPPTDLTYEGVAVSPVPLPDGKYVGLAIDRSNKTLAVIVGVGTAHPAVTAEFRSDVFGRLTHNETSGTDDGEGTGGIAFSFATATRAAVASANGLAIIDLTKPRHPTLKSVTNPPGSPDQTSALAVSADGKTLALNSLGSIYLYRGFLSPANAPLHETATFTPFGSFYPTDAMAFAGNGRLIAQHLAYDSGTATQYEALSSYRLGVDDTNPPQLSVPLAGIPVSNNSMSVYPAGAAPVLTVHRSPTVVRVGDRVRITLRVHHPIGSYSFSIVHGRLPKGLHLHGHVISGRPTHHRTRTIELRALNQYGGAAFASCTVHVKA